VRAAIFSNVISSETIPQTSRAPLWDAGRITREISEGAIHRVLGPAATAELDAIRELGAKVAAALEHPKPLDISLPVFNAVLAAQYYEIFEALNPPRSLALYEPCVGASNPVMLAAEAYSGGEARYVTMNLNRRLREQLREKSAHLKMSVRVIEDNAQRALEILAPGSFDIVCFHHAVNDILQTAVAEPRGMDTAQIDWFQSERQMIEWLAEDAEAGLLEQRGKPEFLQIVAGALRLARPGGHLIFDHWNWRKFIGVEWFPWELFYNLIPTARRWIAESGLPVAELPLAGVDPQWWMILRLDAQR
jgi:SAM-dependent methyltransferase